MSKCIFQVMFNCVPLVWLQQKRQTIAVLSIRKPLGNDIVPVANDVQSRMMSELASSKVELNQELAALGLGTSSLLLSPAR